ncbi:unnamed protein product [Clonostachys rhizophaga]|uniref:Major facilitator superfamily (MFS) profile domain-containing protein n=1 Tax=Clonostachys rhizophaga TaxID=160324 RepID=A0A9N9V8E4_9HYPO|nr:unnamed protein product [Clonostachys rhizophaga]
MSTKKEAASTTVNMETSSVQQAEVDLPQKQGLLGRIRGLTATATNSGSQESAEFLTQHQGEYGDYTQEEAGKVLRKIDWRMMPLQFITSTVSGIDKVLISNAALYGMTQDLELVGQQYSWAGSIYNFGYLVSMFPMTLIIQKFKVGKILAISVILWGVVSMLQGATTSAWSLLLLRFLLGCFETSLFPALTTLNSMWYTKKEQPTRQAVTFSGFQSLITGLISYGIGRSNTAIASWRVLFLVIGAITIVWGVILLFWLPDSPNTEGFVRGKERYIALSRVKDNMTGELKGYQVKEALTDWKTWALFIFFLCMNVPTGGLVTFAAQIVSGFGYSRLETVLLGMPTTPFQVLAVFSVAIPQKWMTNKRSISCAVSLLVPITCSLLLRYLPHENQKGRLVAYYFFYFFWAPYATAVSLSMANVSGQSKKTTVNATIFIAYCVAQIIGPQCFRTNEAPNYPTGYNCILAFEIVAAVAICVYGLGCRWENRQRDKKQADEYDMSTEEMLEDKTDKEKPAFRYVY